MQVPNVETTLRFDRSMSKLPINIQQETANKVAIFKANPLDARLRTHKLKGKMKGLWSFSITYSYRIVFKFTERDTALFYDIGNHQIYK